MPEQEEDICTEKIEIILSHPFILMFITIQTLPSSLLCLLCHWLSDLPLSDPTKSHHDLLQISQWVSMLKGSDGDVPRVTAWGAVGMGNISRGEDKAMRS